MRTRTNTRNYTVPIHHTKHRNGLLDGEILGSSSVFHGEQMTDVLTPNFHELKKLGKPLPVNYCSSEKDVIFSWDGIGSAYANQHDNRSGQMRVIDRNEYSFGGPMTLTNSTAAYPSSSNLATWLNSEFASIPEAPSSLANKLAIEALAMANTEAMDVGTFLAELHKSVDMIRNFGENTVRRATSVEKWRRAENKKRKRLKHPLLNFSEAWLEYRYGWRILLMEMKDIERMLERLSEQSMPVTRRTARETHMHTDETTISSASGVQSFSGFPETSGSITLAGPLRLNYKLTMESGYEVAGGAGVKPLSHLGFIDPLVTMSELIPWHLVLNWFFSTKSTVEAFSPFANVERLWTFYSVKKFARLRYHTWLSGQGTTTGSWPWVAKGDYTGGYVAERSHYIRDTINPHVAIYFRNHLDPQKIIDLIAMLSGVSKKMLKFR